jgi:hypothetical protein
MGTRRRVKELGHKEGRICEVKRWNKFGEEVNIE